MAKRKTPTPIKRSMTLAYGGGTWVVDLMLRTSKYECPRLVVAPVNRQEQGYLFAYKLGSDWVAADATHDPQLATVFMWAAQQLEGPN